MVLGESPDEFLARRARQRERFGSEITLAGGPENLVRIDSIRREEGRPQTPLGNDITNLLDAFKRQGLNQQNLDIAGAGDRPLTQFFERGGPAVGPMAEADLANRQSLDRIRADLGLPPKFSTFTEADSQAAIQEIRDAQDPQISVRRLDPDRSFAIPLRGLAPETIRALSDAAAARAQERDRRGAREAIHGQAQIPGLDAAFRGLGQITDVNAGILRDPIGFGAELAPGGISGGSGGGLRAAISRAEEIGQSPTGIEGRIPGVGTFDVGREVARGAGDIANIAPFIGFPRLAMRAGSAVAGDLAQGARGLTAPLREAGERAIQTGVAPRGVAELGHAVEQLRPFTPGPVTRARQAPRELSEETLGSLAEKLNADEAAIPVRAEEDIIARSEQAERIAEQARVTGAEGPIGVSGGEEILGAGSGRLRRPSYGALQLTDAKNDDLVDFAMALALDNPSAPFDTIVGPLAILRKAREGAVDLTQREIDELRAVFFPSETRGGFARSRSLAEAEDLVPTLPPDAEIGLIRRQSARAANKEAADAARLGRESGERLIVGDPTSNRMFVERPSRSVTGAREPRGVPGVAGGEQIPLEQRLEELAEIARKNANDRNVVASAEAEARVVTRQLETFNRADELVTEQTRRLNELAEARQGASQSTESARLLREEEANIQQILAANPNPDEILEKARTLIGESKGVGEFAPQQNIPLRPRGSAEAETAFGQGVPQRTPMGSFDQPTQTARAASSLNQEAVRAVELAVEQDKILLATLGHDSNILFAARSVITGGAPDSYTATLIARRRAAERGLEIILDRPVARKVADLLMNRNLVERFGSLDNVPESVRRTIDGASLSGFNDEFGAMGTLTQRFKNTMFGLGDVAVFGIQLPAALIRGGIPLMIGTINRMLAAANLPAFALTNTDNGIRRSVNDALLGLGTGTDPSSYVGGLGSVLSYFGDVGRAIDSPIQALADRLNDFQFNTILGSIRNTIAEGNLIVLHLAGQDITNPVVRSAAFKSSNTATSFAQSAASGTHAGFERAVLTSQSLTRSQGENIKEMAKVFDPRPPGRGPGLGGVPVHERILGMMTITATVGSMLVLGKAINDLVGLTDYQMDPTQPGFGTITTKFGKLQLFPQTTIIRTIVRSFRELAEMDEAALARIWTSLFISRASVVGSVTAAGVLRSGFDPEEGFKFGDISQKGQLLNVLPLPPIIQTLVLQGFDLEKVGPELIGISLFDESGRQEASRRAEDFLTPEQLENEELRAEVEGGRVPAILREAVREQDPELFQRLISSSDVTQKIEDDRQNRNDQIEALGTPGIDISPMEWRSRRNDIQIDFRARVDVRTEDFTADESRVFSRYGAIIDEFTTATKTVDWDQVEAAVATRFTVDQQEFIDLNTGLGGTGIEKEYRGALRILVPTDLFEIKPQAWGAVVRDRASYPHAELDYIAKYDTFEEFEYWVNSEFMPVWLEGAGLALNEGNIQTFRNFIPKIVPVLKAMAAETARVRQLWLDANAKNAPVLQAAFEWQFITGTLEQRLTANPVLVGS